MNPAVAKDDSKLPYRNDELVVATPHVERVKAKLLELKPGIVVRKNEVGGDDQEQDDRLGLTLLRLGWLSGDSTAIVLDSVLEALRESFAAAYQGWTPTMGKNRFVDDQVIGGGSMSYGGFGDPEPLTGSQADQRELANWALPRPDRGDKTAGAGVVIGLVDTPISRASEPLIGSWAASAADILENEGNDAPPGVGSSRWAGMRGHATFVTGLILSVAPGARFIVRGRLNPGGRTDSWSAAKAIVELGQAGVDVLNLSFTCLTGDGKPPLALTTAINKVDPKTIIVAAAGNHATVLEENRGMLPVDIDGTKFGERDDLANNIKDITKCVSFPAALDNVVAVGALDAEGIKPAVYSPTGEWVDIMARGNAVSTFVREGIYHGLARWEGTSFATALVTGAIAAGTLPGKTSAHDAWADLKKERLLIVAEPGTAPPPPYVEVERVWIAPEA